MSTKSKLEANNVKISKANKSLLSIRNAVLRPLTEFSGFNTLDATATQSDILTGKTGEYLFLEKRRNKKWLKQMYIL